MDDNRTTTADIPATVVPSGESITIPQGSVVTITHRLGGNFTVTWEYGMARIAGQYAEGIGEELPQWAKKSSQDFEGSAQEPQSEDLWEALKTVYDPEIPVNIVDLGLVYSLDVEALKESNPDAKDGQWKVWMKMTLTAPGCGMGPSIAADAQQRLLQVGGVCDAQVDIVWDPPWNQDMITEVGKMELGLI